MDLKSDIFNIDIDSTLLLSYELEKLNLESIPPDIFEFSDEIANHEVSSDAENTLSSENTLSLENKVINVSDTENKVNNVSDTENKVNNVSDTADEKNASKVCPSDKLEINIETRSRIQKRKKDVNGNEKPVSDENLHQLLKDLTLTEDVAPSDSDNETSEDSSQSKLKERAPIRPRRRANRSRDQNNILSRNDIDDRTQFNGERLRFLSGSSHVQFNDSVNQLRSDTDLTLSFNGNDSASVLSNQDSLFEDLRASGLSSPESGYASSIPGSPPKVSSTISLSLDFIPETVDEQNILDFLAENAADCALPDLSLSSLDLESKNDKEKINDIINYLKDTSVEIEEPVVGLLESSIVPSSVNILEHVPSLSNAQDLNTLPVLSPVITTKAVPKNAETPKKIVYKKLNDKAKKALHDFLSYEEYFAIQKKIYLRIQEDEDNNRPIKVIYVEDESDKASENRTNLHYAVLNSKIEEIYCLIEIQKQYHQPFTDINIRDKYGKTALDYAIQNEMALVIDYLKENTACQSVNI